MNLRYTPAILFLLLTQTLPAQNLIPFLGANGKYGYANEQGEIIVEPEFEGMLEPLTILEPGCNAKKEKGGASTLILRNGMKITQSGRAAPMLNFNDDKGMPADSLHHILLVKSRYKMALANLDTRLYREYFHYENLPPPPSWFPVKSNYMHAYKYNYGLYPVFREAGKMNFVDTAFNEIFSRDFFYGAILSNNYLLLADENKKMGIGDRQGQIRIPLEWGRLEPAKHEGYFLVNAFRGLNFTDPHRAGMIDIDGKVIIDTIYQYIKTAGDNGLIVKSKERFGLMDYSGNWILPLAFRNIFHAFDDYYLAFGQDMKGNVYNQNGEKQFETDYEDISTLSHRNQDQPYFAVFNGTRYGVADSNFELLFQNRFSSISLPRYESAPPPGQTQFIVSESPKVDHLGVCDLSGKMIVPGDYTAITLLPDFPEPLYLAQKGELYGLFNTNGKAVLPVQFSEITTENNPKGDPGIIIWARPFGDSLFFAFDQKGQALPHPAVFKRTSRNRSVVEFVYNDKFELVANCWTAGGYLSLKP
ncbi:MAG: WG repeat-containing protein [Lewinellaceae bacterium]|nr:WG repeat-containing protein [Lewinellaceae bacterium]